MRLGLPGRTKKATTELVMIELLGFSRSQPGWIKPASWTFSTSALRAKLTTSAAKPSMTARVWEPEPP